MFSEIYKPGHLKLSNRVFDHKYEAIEDMEQCMVFCILDRAQSYQKVCDSFDELDKNGLTTRKTLSKASVKDIEKTLRKAGCRFPNQNAKFLHDFGTNTIDLKNATREELVDSVFGVGMKLASLFVRTTRGDQVAVIDVHILRFLAEQGVTTKKYLEQEQAFFKIAKEMGKDPNSLDWQVWESRRIKNR